MRLGGFKSSTARAGRRELLRRIEKGVRSREKL